MVSLAELDLNPKLTFGFVNGVAKLVYVPYLGANIMFSSIVLFLKECWSMPFFPHSSFIEYLFLLPLR